ncbi:MAG: TRAP transporter substrate-binding protein [Desulfatiglans sp.]|jgi:C4-dicarboxylate-binding protein DctP|nr:TRAP transporter substrate-binding protein [Thermodesulfobacteriota bacterium]MEE4354680.1 TRAP transporter substrate-binding protein [Desulfatiglans sp.]
MIDTILRTMLLGMVVPLVLGVSGLDPAHAKEKVYKVQLSSQMPVGHYMTKSLDLFAKRAEEMSEGRLVVQHFSAGQLLKDKEVPSAISSGTLQMAQTYFPWWQGITKNIILEAGDYPDDLEHFFRLSRGPYLRYQSRLLAEKANTKIISPIMYGSGVCYALKRPVKKLGDMKGMKIRIPTKMIAAEVKAMGGVPVVLSSADVYMALQRGTIDGATSGLTSMYSRKWYEVTPFALVNNRIIGADFHIVANLGWYNSLPKDLQKVLLDAGKEADAYCIRENRATQEKVSKGLVAKGVEIYRIPSDEYRNIWGPVVDPVVRAAAVEATNEELTALYEGWIRQTRSK